jgi:predicted enzyme related to lactoylglutathione lyase
MTIRTRTWENGIPCWVELATEDFARAHSFYAAVLGWTESREPEGGLRYAVVKQGQAAVAGFRRSDGADHAGWAVYVAVDDVDAKAAAASAHDAEVLVPPENQHDSDPAHVLGRRAVVTDPSGAPIGLWQGLALNGCQLVNEPGGLCFEELASPDPAAAGLFLESLFGYVRTLDPSLGHEYSTFRLPDETIPLGGVRALVAEDPVGGGWRPFFGVESADEACAEAARRGAQVVRRPFIWAGNEEIALLTDPEGCQFGVVTSTGAGQPERQ